MNKLTGRCLSPTTLSPRGLKLCIDERLCGDELPGDRCPRSNKAGEHCLVGSFSADFSFFNEEQLGDSRLAGEDCPEFCFCGDCGLGVSFLGGYRMPYSPQPSPRSAFACRCLTIGCAVSLVKHSLAFQETLVASLGLYQSGP